MRNMKLKTVIAVAVIGSVALAQAAVVTWDGGGSDGLWFTGTNWDGDAVPNVIGVDSAVITGAAVDYVPAGADMKFVGSSTLTLDGASLTQTTTHWLNFFDSSAFTLINGSALSVTANNINVRGFGNASTFTIDNSTWTGRSLFADDHKDFTLSNGAIVTLTDATLQAGSQFIVTDSTLNLTDIELQAYAGLSTFININDGAQVNLSNTGLSGTAVITKAGGSMVNFAADSTGSMFIGNLSVAQLETMIGESKFGIDGTGSTTLADYNYSVSGSGVTMAIPEPATLGMVVAFGGGLLFIRRKFAM